MEFVSDVPSEQRAVIEGLFLGGGRKQIYHKYSQALNKCLETWQQIKALSAVGQSDWHRQNRDRALCLISRARASHQQLWRPQQADNHIRNDRRMTTRDLAAIFSIGKGSFDKIIHQLGYSQACARWVPRSLTEERKEQRKIICSELLAHYEAESDEWWGISMMFVTPPTSF
jgi:hypothetical protein